ncbi:sigma-70 family RNA polymerase sigma factor [Brachyspira hyodysenteriae]|uniref:sigma-70 family RNA polymerase sigma factor n=1 Tax=Brachyspira hyodysenteriae TaxID=159 RepID=UPI0022CD2434|nr:sigma-70 family RNA polymerase sigma factor [Brachyspira hyodysenteriae]MCZ9840306.1 sigma-70 family RNA polymerase sigma factor [Brachyspira hyodysenteriae]MCZ9848694.1 sigma-70 family RNA polymerase sigma factor [Brachyspira hyodysenteriae]MCZ9860683.1 sigma-70 family RNA polymerase sigma factor [Brachyspira hyodysenteriae]MCZ9869816.1 sigma-70 family RNA polymerase sigma factor [Brachyspira hyodysenteriae]MCZ9875758.1 sigma-70 family RNA polymerase sigma factor [Brachyspira hyodysenteria
MIDDVFIKKLVLEYKATRSIEALKEINEHLSNYIYNYPRKVFGVFHDDALEFYSYYIERIDNIIIKYNETDAKFITWFTYTLRSHYLNFIDHKKRKYKYKKQEISIDAPLCGKDALTLHDVLYDSKSYVMNEYSNNYNESNIEKLSLNMFNYIEKEFSDRDSIAFFIHNLELFINLIIQPLMKYFNINYEEAYSIIEKARATYIKKYNEIIKQQDKIAKINAQIEINNKRGLFTVHLASKKQNYIKKLHSIKINVPYDFIAKLLNITSNAVTKIINKIKASLKEHFNNLSDL